MISDFSDQLSNYRLISVLAVFGEIKIEIR